jgi:hypothetical protein
MHYLCDFLSQILPKSFSLNSVPVTLHCHPCYSAEFGRVVTGSSAVPMPSSTSAPAELVDLARTKRGVEPARTSPSESHGSKKRHTGTTFQQGKVATSSGSSSCQHNMHSNEEPGKLPTGVVAIFPAYNDQSRCCCPTAQPQGITLASCDAAQVFLSQYGADNLAYLQERERREFPSEPHTTTRASKTSSAQSMLSPLARTSDEDGIASDLAGYVSPPPGGVSNAKFFPQSGGVTGDNFLEKLGDFLPKQPWVTTHMRATVVSWLVEVTIDLGISDEAFHVAVSILDRVFRSGVTAEQYRENPDCVWDAGFFCVTTRELQALGWYVIACDGPGVSSLPGKEFSAHCLVLARFQCMCMDGEQAVGQLQTTPRRHGFGN